MSTAREKDQKDYDLQDLIKVVDSALTSDNPAVQNALRGLLLISTIVSAEHPDQAMRNGPLARIMEDHNDLIRRLARLEDDLNQIKWNQQKQQVEPFMPTVPAVGPYPGTSNPWTGTGPYPTPTWTTTFSAGDDPAYKGAYSNTPTIKLDKGTV